MGLEKDGYKTKLWENDVNLWDLNGFEPTRPHQWFCWHILRHISSTRKVHWELAKRPSCHGIKQNGIGQVISMMGQQLHDILRIDDRRIWSGGIWYVPIIHVGYPNFFGGVSFSPQQWRSDL